MTTGGGDPNEKSDFLGYGFQPRRSKNRFGKYFINFSPAISDKAGKSIREEIRSWNLHLRSDKSIEDLSRMRLRTCRVQSKATVGGCNNMGGIIARRYIRTCGNWTVRWPVGR